MNIPENVYTVFTAEIESDGKVEIPEQEIEIGDLEVGETYRVTVLDQVGENSKQAGTSSRQATDHSRQDEPPVEEGEILEVEIEDIGEQGDGIAKIGPGYVIFVPDTQIGDRVKIGISEARNNFAFAEVIEEEPVSG